MVMCPKCKRTTYIYIYIKEEMGRENTDDGRKVFSFHKSAIIMCTHFFTWQRKIYHLAERESGCKRKKTNQKKKIKITTKKRMRDA